LFGRAQVFVFTHICGIEAELFIGGEFLFFCPLLGDRIPSWSRFFPFCRVYPPFAFLFHRLTEFPTFHQSYSPLALYILKTHQLIFNTQRPPFTLFSFFTPTAFPQTRQRPTLQYPPRQPVYISSQLPLLVSFPSPPNVFFTPPSDS